MKKISIVLLLIVAFPVQAQTISDLLKKNIGGGPSVSAQEARMSLKLGDRGKSLACYAMAINESKSMRNNGKGVDADLLAEYAYALALNHDFEAALLNIDRARLLGAKNGDFFASQILLILGHSASSIELSAGQLAPEWIRNEYQTLTAERIMPSSVATIGTPPSLSYANNLSAERQNIKAIAIFEELIVLSPYSAIVFIDYSALWESMGHPAYAANLLKRGISLFPSDTMYLSVKKMMETHLVKLESTVSTIENNQWLKKLLSFDYPRTIVYVGSTAMKGMLSVNGRFGMSTIKKFNYSLNMGVSHLEGQFLGNIGLSAYKAFGIFIAGVGINDQFGGGTNIFSLAPTIGLSFPDKQKSSSFDITLNLYLPLMSDTPMNYGLSIGRTFYLKSNEIEK